MRTHHAVVVFASALVLTLGSCTKSTGLVAVTGIKVTPQTLQFTAIGQVQQLTATIVPANATLRAVTWESTDPSIASVDATGKVTAHASGVGVFVTAYSHDRIFQASANISVQP